MKPSLHISITDYYPEAEESERLPASASYHVDYSQKRSWRGSDWWVSLQTFDARHAYIYLLEVNTKRPLRFGMESLRRDMRWLYPLSGEFALHTPDGQVALGLQADEHIRTLSGPGKYEMAVPPGRHLLFAFALEWAWTRRYARTVLAYLRDPKPVPITPAIRGHLRTLASLSLEEGMLMDTKIYWPIARITNLTRQLYKQRPDDDPTFQLAQSARRHIRDVLKLGGEPPTVAELALHFEVSADRLSRAHKKYYGKSLQAYLMRKRLNKAYKLLSEEGWSVSATAYRLGFSDVQAFNKLFRKYFEVAPSKVRKR